MKIAVVGTGYVGLVAGACLAETGNDVVCVDKDDAKVRLLRKGRVPFYEPGLAELVEKNKSEGRLTFTAGAELSRRIQALLMGGATQLVLNLEDVSYVDSAGLGAVVEAFTAVRQKAARLTLLNPTERTRHLLEITGLARIIETFDSQAAALASYENVDAILTWDAEGGGPSSSTSEPTSLSATGLGSPTRRQ